MIFPYPSDLRLSPTGGPIASAFPNPTSNELVGGLQKIVGDRAGFPVIPVAYFQFSAPLPTKNPDDVIAADPSSTILLVDVDAASDERGKLFPTVAVSMPTDNYTADERARRWRHVRESFSNRNARTRSSFVVS